MLKSRCNTKNLPEGFRKVPIFGFNPNYKPPSLGVVSEFENKQATELKTRTIGDDGQIVDVKRHEIRAFDDNYQLCKIDVLSPGWLEIQDFEPAVKFMSLDSYYTPLLPARNMHYSIDNYVDNFTASTRHPKSNQFISYDIAERLPLWVAAHDYNSAISLVGAGKCVVIHVEAEKHFRNAGTFIEKQSVKTSTPDRKELHVLTYEGLSEPKSERLFHFKDGEAESGGYWKLFSKSLLCLNMRDRTAVVLPGDVKIYERSIVTDIQPYKDLLESWMADETLKWRVAQGYVDRNFHILVPIGNV